MIIALKWHKGEKGEESQDLTTKWQESGKWLPAGIQTDSKGAWGNLGRDVNVLYLNCGGVFDTTYQAINLKWVHFIVYKVSYISLLMPHNKLCPNLVA